MKRIVVFLTVVFLTAGAVFAQGWGGGRGDWSRWSAPETVKIEGTLQLHKGQFAVASGNDIYYVPVIGRYAGFIEGLKEGSTASFEGYVRGNLFRPTKMTISGKTYELVGGNNGNDGRKDDFNNGRRGPGFTSGFGPGCGNCGPGFGGNRGGRGMGWR